MKHAITLVEVKNRFDRFEGYYTLEAYAEARLQMSTGDFHSHKHAVVTRESDVEYLDIDMESGEFFVVNEIDHIEKFNRGVK